eukprot:359692_1
METKSSRTGKYTNPNKVTEAIDLKKCVLSTVPFLMIFFIVATIGFIISGVIVNAKASDYNDAIKVECKYDSTDTRSCTKTNGRSGTTSCEYTIHYYLVDNSINNDINCTIISNSGTASGCACNDDDPEHDDNKWHSCWVLPDCEENIYGNTFTFQNPANRKKLGFRLIWTGMAFGGLFVISAITLLIASACCSEK